MTCIVKGTFSLKPGDKASLSEEQLFPGGDEYYPDDEERSGATRYESDFACFKPQADLLLTGKCHPPGGSPVPACDIAFHVGSRSRVLRIFGNRFWEKQWLRWVASEPEPFSEMEIRYENSYGDEKINPVGKRSGPIRNDRGIEIRQLPNIEDPANPVESPKSRPDPAGFGPLGRMWKTRQAKMGTYTGQYTETRWPWFPDDFNWSYFNAAPPEMQIEGYLHGDEQLFFENLHPEHPKYHSQLPGIRIRCFLRKQIESGEQESSFEEISMNLDTLWVDMEAEKLVLVWRGSAQVLSEDYEEVKHVFIQSESLDHPPASIEECRRQFQACQDEEEKIWALDLEEPTEPETLEEQPEQAIEPDTPGPAEQKISPIFLHSQMNALLTQMGVDPDSLPPEVKAKQSNMMEKLSETNPDKVAEMERQEIDLQMRKAFAKLDMDPDHLPPLSAGAKAEQLRFMKELGLKPADIASDPELGKVWALMGAAMPKMGLDPENLDPLIEQTRKLHKQNKNQKNIEGKDPESTKDSPPPSLTCDEVRQRAVEGESFSGEDFHGLDLSGLDLSNLDFSGANLVNAILVGTNFQSSILADADLTGVDLSEADCTGANMADTDLTNARMKESVLTEADFTDSIFTNADLTGAILTNAVFEKARMAGTVLDQVEAKGADFNEADLTESSFRKSSCSGADFSKAVLDNADFQGADLSEASLEGSIGRKVNMSEANLTGLQASEGCDFSEGIFWNTLGPGSIWENSNLEGSDFRGSRMEGAVFTGACLNRANLAASDMRHSRFNKASLQEACLVQMNLFQGSLEQADLTSADLSGSNMYAVEFLDAIVENIRTEKTNLKMSKLQERATEA